MGSYASTKVGDGLLLSLGSVDRDDASLPCRLLRHRAIGVRVKMAGFDLAESCQAAAPFSASRLSAVSTMVSSIGRGDQPSIRCAFSDVAS